MRPRAGIQQKLVLDPQRQLKSQHLRLQPVCPTRSKIGGWGTFFVTFCAPYSRRVADPSTRAEVNAYLLRVPLDENEGVVKRHLFAAMLCRVLWGVTEYQM